MTKSRTLQGLVLLVLIWPPRVTAQAGMPPDEPPLPQPGTPDQPTIVTADEAMAINRARVRNVLDTECPSGTLDQEVVVCGRRQRFPRYRVPAADPDLGAATRERANGAPLHAMDAGSTRCSAVGRDQQCGGGLNVIGIGVAVVQGIIQALANRD